MSPTPVRNTALDAFVSPPASCRPTPLFWWSGTDLDPARLRAQLIELAGKGIGGTIVGYSHLPDGALDHGQPSPLSEEWWQLFRWFTEESARLGMSVGIQDYGINGPILLRAGQRTRDRHPGSLRHLVEHRRGPGTFTTSSNGDPLVAAVVRSDFGASTPLTVVQDGAALRYSLPPGAAEVSLVLRRPGRIGHHPSSFDPLHPDAGRLVIELFYQPFRDHLGDLFGTTFKTIFQDELDFGTRMPMWNDLVADRLLEVHGFDPQVWLPALWADLGPGTRQFRAAYRDVVVGLLEDHYFRPVFEWHERHHTSMMIDQVSRGDLRSGRHAYGDYMQTMRWYNGPGNDDPDLTTPRSVAAFKVSASLARLNDRPFVASEAFHSSGWGISPELILTGLNAGFAYGVNHVIMHGLNHTTEGGWWEWASPDFHFRQPWWEHSKPLWDYVTRTCAVLRQGTGVVDVAVLDPTQDLDLTGDAATSPECATAVLTVLAQAGQDCDLIDRPHLVNAVTRDGWLESGHCSYRALIVPDLRAVRADVAESIRRFSESGGIVVVLGVPPMLTETGPCPVQTWATALTLRPDQLDELPGLLSGLWELDFTPDQRGLVAAHRRTESVDLYFVANVTDRPITASVDLRARGRVETWDPWTGAIHACSGTPAHQQSTRVDLDLGPGLSTIVAVDSRQAPHETRATSGRLSTRELHGPWSLEVQPTLDNTFGDFEYGGAELGIETLRVEVGPSPSGPWVATPVRDGPKFLALGPVPVDETDNFEMSLLEASPAARQPVPVGGATLEWRPYPFSHTTGIAGDPLLADRMTGPHGLKYVPDEFLDPQALDPNIPAGSVYYFWSTVMVEQPELVVSAGSRAPFVLWVGGRPLLKQEAETPAARTPAWGLRDLRVTAQTVRVRLSPGRTQVLVRLRVCAEQPTRASVTLGSSMPGPPPRARLRWWHGDEPCLPFDPHPDDPDQAVWLQTSTPPGFRSVELVVRGRPVSAALGPSFDAVPFTSEPSGDGLTTVTLQPGSPVLASQKLLLELRSAGSGYHGGALVEGPLRWTLEQGEAASSWFTDHGLQDFSGLVRYRANFDLDTVGRVHLALPGLEGTARVTLNGREIGYLLASHQTLDLSAALHLGVNTIEVEVANTLVNRFAVLPSPFARMQEPGGGFGYVKLTLLAGDQPHVHAEEPS